MQDTTLNDEIFAAAEADVPDETTLSKMSAYVKELGDIEQHLIENERLARVLQDRYNTVAGGYVSTMKATVNGLLPELMKSCGTVAFDTTNGETVSIKSVYSGSITEAKSEEAFKWLRDNKFGDLIKNTFKVALGAGDDKKADKLIKALVKADLPYEQKESVHSGTLSAFIREQTEAGKDLPTDLLGIFVYEAAKITKQKKKGK